MISETADKNAPATGLLLLFLLLLNAPLWAADSPVEDLTARGIAEFRSAYEAWDGDMFEKAAKLFQQACDQPSASATHYYWLGVAHFHRMLQLKGASDAASGDTRATAAMDAAIEALATAVKLKPEHAESHALLGTLYGMKIAGSLLQAVRLGPRVVEHRDKAIALGSANPRVKYLLGMCQFHTAKKPAACSEALATLLEAEKLFEAEAKTSSEPLEPRWGRHTCLAFIGRTHETLGQPQDAAVYFQKALAVNPQNQMARDGLARVTPSK